MKLIERLSTLCSFWRWKRQYQTMGGRKFPSFKKRWRMASKKEFYCSYRRKFRLDFMGQSHWIWWKLDFWLDKPLRRFQQDQYLSNKVLKIIKSTKFLWRTLELDNGEPWVLGVENEDDINPEHFITVNKIFINKEHKCKLIFNENLSLKSI